MKRREFLKGSAAAAAFAGLTASTLQTSGAASTGGNQEYYELRVYRLKPDAGHDVLDAFLEKAFIPGLNRLGIKPVGVFTEKEPKDGPAVYVLAPYPSLDSFASVSARLYADPEFQKAGADYLQLPKATPGFDRIDTWLMLAFAGLPKMDLPSYCRDKKPRLFEIRIYESYSEAKALKKVEMFNAGEVDTMKEVGLGPIFFGQTLAGKNLPHLIYMLSAENQDDHKSHWGAFGKHSVWQKLQKDPQYADTVSHIDARVLIPTGYSQI